MIEDLIVSKQKVNLIAVPGAFPVEGGVPLVVNNQVIGASDGMPVDDGAVAQAGAKSLEP